MGFILVSGVLFGFMSALVRVASDRGLPSMEIVLVSGLVRWIGLVGTLVRSGHSPLGPSGVRHLLAMRSLCGLTAFSAVTYAFGVMPIGDAMSIMLTSPVWAALLAWAILGEPLHPIDCLTMLLAMAGVVLVARPPWLFGSAGSHATPNVTLATTAAAVDAALPGWVAVLFGAIFAGSVAVLVRLIKKAADVHPAVIAHAYALITV